MDVQDQNQLDIFGLFVHRDLLRYFKISDPNEYTRFREVPQYNLVTKL